MCEICEAGGDLCDLGIITDAACAACEDDGGDDDGLDLCFSEVATVQVLQADRTEVTVAMKDLKIGDRILTGMNQYQTVYAFAHHKPTKAARFYQIHSEHADRPLEVTADHLVFLGDKKHPVAAANIKVGDILRSSMGHSQVTKISWINRHGKRASLRRQGNQRYLSQKGSQSIWSQLRLHRRV